MKSQGIKRLAQPRLPQKKLSIDSGNRGCVLPPAVMRNCASIEFQMNRLLFAIVLSICTATPSQGQLVNHCGLRIGGSIAFTTMGVLGDQYRYNDPRSGIDIGVFNESFGHSFFTLSSELHYVQKGFKEGLPLFPDGSIALVKSNVRLDYLSFALLPKFRKQIQSSALFFLLGPRVDFFIANAIQVEGPEPQTTDRQQYLRLSISQIASPRIGATIGVGIETRFFWQLLIGLDLRVSPNLQSLYSYADDVTTENSYELLFTIAQ